MTNFYLITGYCGDYYCEETHPVALCDSMEKATQLLSRLDEVRLISRTKKRELDIGTVYKSGRIVKVPLNQFIFTEKII